MVFFIGIPKSLPESCTGLLCILFHHLVRDLQILQLNHMLVQPLAVWLFLRIILLQFFVSFKPVADGICHQKFSRVDSSFFFDVFFPDLFQHASLGRQVETVISGQIIPGWTKTVPVQDGSHHVPVTEQY